MRALLTLLAEGQSSAEIAAARNRSPAEVDDLLNAAMTRLHLAGRAQAVMYATRKGLVPAELRPYLV